MQCSTGTLIGAKVDIKTVRQTSNSTGRLPAALTTPAVAKTQNTNPCRNRSISKLITDDKVKHTSEQTSKQANQTNELAITPGAGFGAPSLAKRLATRSMARCPFAHQVCTTMQTQTLSAVQALNQLPRNNGCYEWQKASKIERPHTLEPPATSTPRRCLPSVYRHKLHPSSSSCSTSCS